MGTIAGYVGGGTDSALMRLTDVVMSFPFFVVIMVMVSILGPGLGNVILALGLLGWPGVARIVRGCVLSAKESDYVKAGRALGYSGLRLVARHIYPNILGPILVHATRRDKRARMGDRAGKTQPARAPCLTHDP